MNNGPQVSHLDFNGLISREWISANGVGGYASSTIPSLNTRKYHGLLVAAMAPPVRRMVLLSRVEESLFSDGKRWDLSSSEYPGTVSPQGHQRLRAFSTLPFPRWAYQCDGWTLEKQLRLIKGENTVVLTYTLLGGDRTASLDLRPLFALRPIHELMQQWNGRPAAEERSPRHYRIPATLRTPELFFAHTGAFEARGDWYLNTVYRREFERGYAGMEDLWSPGTVQFALSPGQPAHFVCSTDPIELQRAVALADEQSAAAAYVTAPVSPSSSRPAAPLSPDPAFDALLRAAAQFVVATPSDGSGERPSEKSVTTIGHYPWGPPLPRSALVGFSGLFLVPGRFAEARALLLSMAASEQRGLMPTVLPEDGSAPLYNGADVSLWFVNAVWEYFRYTSDVATLRRHLLDTVLKIVDRYRGGTALGIGADSEGLLQTRAPGVATTWMDAKVRDWVLTPRQGRPVELNALWYNAVCCAAELSERYGSHDRAAELASFARGIKDAFNRRFWNESLGCCYDVVEDLGMDPSVRPNQLFAISLPFAALSLERHSRLLNKVRDELLTPVGMRTLSPRESAYVGRHEGNVVSRDRALNGGSAQPWLLGPYVSAVLRVRGRGEPARAEALAALEGCLAYMLNEGLGQLCELFDGDAPHRPGGATACAAAVGQILRAYTEDVLDLGPAIPFPSGISLNDLGILEAPPKVTNPA
ncbi:MAG: putative glycogen debranching enzyme [Phycisphaerales bacterium]|nr:putative glycogen debranching enzyme [Phycisphaerales bacterium]